MIKTRTFKDSNYRGIYFNGKTIRIQLDSSKPITDLEYPEFYDIKLTNKCNGKCSFCYQDSTKNSKDYEAIKTLNKFFGSMSKNEKPFQIAYGGGEPTLHYQFHEVMKLTRKHDISPNYTTNGMFIDTKDFSNILNTTKKYCEGVAVSCHDHLEDVWKRAAQAFIDNNIFTNFHNIISDKESVDKFVEIYNEWSSKVKYFVVLPIIEHGRAKNIKTDFKYFFDKMKKIKAEKGNINDIAFGANFFPYLKDDNFLKLSYINLKL